MIAIHSQVRSSLSDHDFDDRFLQCFNLLDSEQMTSSASHQEMDRDEKLKIQAKVSQWCVLPRLSPPFLLIFLPLSSQLISFLHTHICTHTCACYFCELVPGMVIF